jgi:hypothetical protein
VSGQGEARTFYFAETPGIPAEFIFATNSGVAITLSDVKPSRTPWLSPAGGDGKKVQIVLLSEADSLALVKDDRSGTISFETPRPVTAPRSVEIASIRGAGPAREIPIGKISQPVATEPTDADFAQAAVWRIKLPADFASAGDALLRIRYVGDVARVYLGGKLITDDFYNGLPLEIGLRRHAAELKTGELTIAILPLRRDAVTGAKPQIYLSDSARPDFGGKDTVGRLDGVEIVARENAVQ